MPSFTSETHTEVGKAAARSLSRLPARTRRHPESWGAADRAVRRTRQRPRRFIGNQAAMWDAKPALPEGRLLEHTLLLCWLCTVTSSLSIFCHRESHFTRGWVPITKEKAVRLSEKGEGEPTSLALTSGCRSEAGSTFHSVFITLPLSTGGREVQLPGAES